MSGHDLLAALKLEEKRAREKLLRRIYGQRPGKRYDLSSRSMEHVSRLTYRVRNLEASLYGTPSSGGK